MAHRTIALLGIMLTKGLIVSAEVITGNPLHLFSTSTEPTTTTTTTVLNFTHYEYNGILTDTIIYYCTFPMTIIGTVIIDDTVNVTNKQIQDFLSCVCNIEGKIIIRNTSLKKVATLLNFLPLNYEDTFLVVENNSLLETVEVLNVKPLGGHIVLSNNPKLKYQLLCVEVLQKFFQRFHILDNPHVCGCVIPDDKFFQRVLDLPDNCTTLIGNISLTSDQQPAYESLERKLGSVETIYGTISVVNTNYKDLGFFKSLNEVIYELPRDFNKPPQIFISKNAEMTKLKWYLLAQTRFLQIVIHENPKLCLQTNEHIVGVKSELGGKITVPFCEDEILPKHFYRIQNGSWEGIGENHTVIIGDVLINEKSDISQFIKFSNITMIYGHLIIQNTKLRTNSWLYNLEQLYPPRTDDPAILVENNSALVIYELKTKYSRNRKVIVRNNPKLKLTIYTCSRLEEMMNYEVHGNLENCGIVHDNGESRVNDFYFLKTLLVFLLMSLL